MLLSDRELLIALVANAIAVYSILHERGELPEKTTMYGFVLDAIGADKYKTKLTPEIIDDVFASVTSAHNS